MGMIIIAPDPTEPEGPVIFLAGPIQGAVSWHEEAVRHLTRLAPERHIASPRRPFDPTREFPTRMYHEQVDWETRFLHRAASCGVVLFWLAAEQKEYHRCERSYARPRPQPTELRIIRIVRIARIVQRQKV